MINQKLLRTLLKKTENKFISVRGTMQILKLNKKASFNVLTLLEEQGLIDKSAVDKTYWTMSLRGKVLVHKVFAKEFNVDTLKKHLGSFLERAAIVNSSSKFPESITSVKIISEYPIKHKGTGICIAYSLSRKPISDKEYDKIANELRRQHKRAFGNIVEYYCYPQKAVRRFLKSRSNVLKLREYTESQIKKFKGHIILGEE